MFEFYEFIRKGSHDAATKEGELEFPAGYMFKNVPKWESDDMGDPVEMLFLEHQRHGITQAIVSVEDEIGRRAVRDLPDHFFASIGIDPNEGMEAVRKIDRYASEFDLKAVGAFPSGLYPQVALNDKMFYPIYAKCIEVDVAFCSTAGVPGPRLQFAPQEVALIDEVCWFFPELKFVTRHGCEPWTALAAKLLLKWPNLYYSTTAFAPKYYPKDIINFANTRGADKVIFSGYFPAGLTYERIFNEMPDVPFRDHVWPKFLRENAQRVFKLPEKTGTPHECRSVREGPGRGRRHRHDDRVPGAARGTGEALRLHPQADARRRQPGVGVPRAVHVQGRAALRPVDDPVEMLMAKMNQHGITKALTGMAVDGNAKIALERYPDRFIAVDEHRPEPGHGRGAQARRGRARARRQVDATAGARASSRRCR